ncbi:hypothetical protein U5N28_18550 [Lysinibacillus telephonicus]|uniref:hypothetical protein n=1 Tax=Lysinibacillus telephonicus TaxID=1714840 RepID=UPI0031FC8544
MEKYKWSTYLWKLLWVVGLIILSLIILNFENQVRNFVDATLYFSLIFWFNLISSILFGIYISLIFVKTWSLNINTTLLWGVSIPCILISFFYPIMLTLGKAGVPNWIIQISTSEVLGIVSGMTLILSFFSNQSKIGN